MKMPQMDFKNTKKRGGWYGESERHSMAARGIRSGRKIPPRSVNKSSRITAEEQKEVLEQTEELEQKAEELEDKAEEVKEEAENLEEEASELKDEAKDVSEEFEESID